MVQAQDSKSLLPGLFRACPFAKCPLGYTKRFKVRHREGNLNSGLGNVDFTQDSDVCLRRVWVQGPGQATPEEKQHRHLGSERPAVSTDPGSEFHSQSWTRPYRRARAQALTCNEGQAISMALCLGSPGSKTELKPI